MGKITVNPGCIGNQPKGEHIVRIMYDDNEPPKNYIWGKSDGCLYKWNGSKWENMSWNGPSYQQYVTSNEFNYRLKLLKTEIISYLTKLINMRDCGDRDGESAIEWINENVIPDLRRLQEIDHNSFATKDELSSAIENVASSETITEINNNLDSLDSRLDILEEIDHSSFVTAHDLPN